MGQKARQKRARVKAALRKLGMEKFDYSVKRDNKFIIAYPTVQEFKADEFGELKVCRSKSDIRRQLLHQRLWIQDAASEFESDIMQSLATNIAKDIDQEVMAELKEIEELMV